jgi:enterochelin esterase-like enzyme
VDWFYDIRLTDGPLYWASLVLGLAGGAYLLLPPGRSARRWLIRVVIASAAAVALVALVHWALINIFAVFPANVPDAVLGWVTAAVGAVLLALLRLPGNSPRRRITGGLAALLVVALSSVQINAYFGLNRTVSDLLGAALSRIPTLEAELLRQPGASGAVPLQGWEPQGDLPDGGVLRKAAIPSTASGLATRESYIYLPPAYLAANRPALPVLVLIPGQPGGPADWLTGGALQSHLDAFASAHGGVAPVVVVPDPNGSQNANAMCMDSRIAKADTYLTRDVAGWISTSLDVDTDHRHWAAGGFSFGGTCAVQLATRHPDLFSAALGFSAEAEPAIAKERQKTIDASFPGDPEAFNRLTPLEVMKEQTFEGSGMYLTAGSEDHEFVAYMRTLEAAARNAGFDVRAFEVEHTGHSWETSSRRIGDALQFLWDRWGLPQ